jgi:hypothetical protein
MRFIYYFKINCQDIVKILIKGTVHKHNNFDRQSQFSVTYKKRGGVPCRVGILLIGLTRPHLWYLSQNIDFHQRMLWSLHV